MLGVILGLQMSDLQMIGRYEVERRLGYGSAATVWLARDVDLDARVAIKVLSRSRLQDHHAQERFMREARVLRMVDDPRVVRIHTVDQLEDGRPFFVMEYADGGSLRARLDQGGRQASFSVLYAIRLSQAIAQGLAAAHALGVIHGDLKPSNVLFKRSHPASRAGASSSATVNGDERLLLADFGAAVDTSEGEVGEPMGTLGYIAPEVSQGQVTPQADLYAAGAVLAELLVGGGGPVLIDPSEDVATQLDDVFMTGRQPPTAIVEALVTALQPDPVLRFETAHAWFEALEHGVDSLIKADKRAAEFGQTAEPELGQLQYGDQEATSPSPTTNLPHQLTRFVGRYSEIKELERLIVDRPLVTLTGAAGIGKSRLAYQTASQFESIRFPGGVWVVEFAPIAQPELVPPLVARVLGVMEEPDQTVLEALVAHLKDARTLLVLDNCEHVLDAAALVASELVAHCPDIRVLATSRQALGVTGEYVRPLGGLETPHSAPDVELGEAMSYDAVALFVQRARDAKFDFEVTDDNVQAVAQVCESLDGLPLALELAAARLRHSTIEEVLEGLDERFTILKSQTRDALPHHRTLRAAIDWSYVLLDPDEQQLFRCLAVYAGGFDVTSVHGVCGLGRTRVQTLELLGRLIDRSIVQIASSEHASRYTLLESLRQYAWEKLGVAGELEQSVNNHRRYFVEFARNNSKPGLQVTPEAFASLEFEDENLQAAMVRSIADGYFSDAADIITRTERLYVRNGRFDVGVREIELILEQAERLAPLVHAEVLLTGAWMTGEAGRLAESLEWSNMALELAPRLEPADQHLMAIAMNNIGLCHAYLLGDYETASRFCEESLDCTPGDHPDHAIGPMSSLGEIAYLKGDFSTAEHWFQRCIDQTTNWKDLTVFCLVFMARIRSRLGDVTAAERCLRTAFRTAGEHQVHTYDANMAAVEANLLVQKSDRESARSKYQESLRLFQESGVVSDVAEVLTSFSDLQHRSGRDQEAARILGAASAWRQRNHQKLHPVDRSRWTDQIEALRESLGELAFDEAWAVGASMSNAETLVYVIDRDREGHFESETMGNR